jgi:2-aminoadipate transaminase
MTKRPRAQFAAWLQTGNTITQQFLAIGGQPDMVSLAGGLPAAELYPVETLRAAADRALTRWGSAAMEYGPVEGLLALRDAIAQRLRAQTGRAFGVENVLLTTGAMQGLDLVGKALVDAGESIVVQFPTYLGALDAWRPRCPVYEKLDWNELERPGFDATLGRAKFVYAVPNYSNPTGVLVPQVQRSALLEKVLASGTWLLEDDPYHALQFEGETGPSMLASAAARSDGPYQGPVIYLGTLSKSIAPGLRVGWAVAEIEMIRMLALAKQSTDLSSSIFTQAVALDLIERDFDLEHARKIVPVYRQRRDALCAEASMHLAEWFEWDVPPGGMFVWMRARDPRIDTDALYEIALQEKVAFVPSSVFDPMGKDRSSMRLNFTRGSPEVIKEGVRRLETAVRRYLHR